MPCLRRKALNGLDSVKSIAGRKAVITYQTAHGRPGEYDAIRLSLLQDWEEKQSQLISLAHELSAADNRRRELASRGHLASSTTALADSAANEVVKNRPGHGPHVLGNPTRDRTVQRYFDLTDGLSFNQVAQSVGYREIRSMLAFRIGAVPKDSVSHDGASEGLRTETRLGQRKHEYSESVRFYLSLADDVGQDPVVQSARAAVGRAQGTLAGLREDDDRRQCDAKGAASSIVKEAVRLEQGVAAGQAPKLGLRRKKNNPFFALSGIEGTWS